jgi:hypothetical protein
MTFKPSAKKQLEKAHAALAETDQKLADIGARRSAALLASDDNNQIVAFDREREELERVAKVQRDRIELLKVEVEKEEGLARAKRRAELIGRVKAKIAEADAVGIETQAVADQLVKLFRKECQLRLAIVPMWAWDNSDRGAIGLSGVAVKERYCHYFYKIGATLNAGGGLPFDRMQPSFPGGVCPRLEWRLLPEAIPSMADVMAEKSAYAAKVLDGGKVATVDTTAPDPAVAASQKTAAENRQAQLLKQINEASRDTSEQGERRYEKLVAEIAALSLEAATAPSPAA